MAAIAASADPEDLAFSEAKPADLVNPIKLAGYLNDVIKTLLEDPAANILDQSLDGSSGQSSSLVLNLCSTFAADSAPTVIFIIRNSHEELQDPQDDQSMSPSPPPFFLSNFSGAKSIVHTYRLDIKPSLSPATTECVAVIKGPLPIDASQALHTRLQTVLLSSAAAKYADSNNAANPYESLHSMIHLVISPFFEASAQLSTAINSSNDPKSTANNTAAGTTRSNYQDKDSVGAVPATRRKFAELELSLLHLQQNIEIPELTLSIHPVIEQALDANPGAESTIDIIPPKYLQDTDFLNTLQSNVNGWIRSIQGITRMTRDPYSGTATQEINFWLSMETALKHIEDQLQGPGVTLTLNILRNAKRFHATVSFLSDTGIKESSETVAKYNQLMRDFPLDELISATTLNAVQRALLLIFSHLNKKLRITPYPVWRVLALVEGISADFNAALQTILGGSRLMHLDYTTYLHTTQQAAEIFGTWDDQVKEFTNIARDVTRKRSEKFIPIRINAKHLKTKERLDYITNFRKRHQELRNTLAKVLGTGNTSDHAVLMGLEGINPLDEIEEAYGILKNINALDTSEGEYISTINLSTLTSFRRHLRLESCRERI